MKSGKEISDSDKELKQINNSKVEKKVQRGNIKNEPHLRPRPSATQSSSEESSRRMRGRPPGSLNKAKKEPVSQKLPPSYPRRPFPGPNEASRIVDVPEFYPSEEQFQNPIEYINAIKHQAEPYGMCKIVPPISWKPEFKLNEDMRFFSQVQHVHKLHQRWGPNVQKIECIRKHLESQGVELQPIVFGGIELDMWNFLQTLQQHGGLQNVQNKKGFNKLADALKIPKLSQDRPARLYDAYCKYLLSYDTLSKDEKLKLEHQVLAERQKRKKIKDEEDECCLKGKSMSLKEYQRIARNIQAMYFKEDPSPEVVEAEFWKITHDRLNHLVVQCGHIDTATSGSGFPSKRESPFAKHGWNFTQLAQNSGSVLRHLGPVCGLTVPTIHVGMLFSTSCWSTDPHLLPYVVYSHSGADVIWNCIPKPETEKFKVAMKSLVPNLLSDDPIWLPEDTVMVPPDTLVSKGVSITKCIQRPREFLVVFPESYTSTISCGYSVSESVHYATPDWLPTGAKAAKLLKDSCERELFSMSRLLFNLARNEKTSTDLLKLILPLLQSIIEEEVKLRKELAFHGLKDRERMGTINENPSPSAKWRRGVQEEDDVCEVSKQICYSSRVENEHDSSVFSLQHAVPHIMKRKNLKHCRLYYRYTEKELMGILDKVKERIVSKTPSKSTEATSPRKKAKI
ncbi:unnamed protein product [Owenia fusiformis]|uniref:Uncharacterized protein n=1 Tax=Owenia fusiformis TaxID=6347 RepID=A0A8J1US83_OWEFU|nr:unnamed protein product [Owenia fusiformis]